MHRGSNDRGAGTRADIECTLLQVHSDPLVLPRPQDAHRVNDPMGVFVAGVEENDTK